MNGGDWPLPDLEEANYITRWFCDLGLSFGYVDIESWSRLTGDEPTPNEVELLVMMTNIYQNGLIKFRAKGYNSRPPYDGRTIEQKNAMIEANLSSLFGD